jgi:hypothetical protein
LATNFSDKLWQLFLGLATFLTLATLATFFAPKVIWGPTNGPTDGQVFATNFWNKFLQQIFATNFCNKFLQQIFATKYGDKCWRLFFTSATFLTGNFICT